MATGSAATKRHEAKLRLAAANYWTGASSANSQPRCGNCTAVAAHPGLFGTTRYDRWCTTHDAGVKTHGHCRQHAKAEG